MPVKIYKPTSPGRRGMTGYSYEDLTQRDARSRRMLDLYL